MGASTIRYSPQIVIRVDHHEVRGMKRPTNDEIEQIIHEALSDHEWRSDYKLQRDPIKEDYFVKLKSPHLLSWFPKEGSKETREGICISRLSLDVENTQYIEYIKESQIISIVRYAEMLGEIINTRLPNFTKMTLQVQFDACVYANAKKCAGPGDIVERESQHGKYFYFDRAFKEDGKLFYVLISIEALLKASDQIITTFTLGSSELKSVDHIPQVSDLERSNLLRGEQLGTREFLIAKWRPVL